MCDNCADVRNMIHKHTRGIHISAVVQVFACPLTTWVHYTYCFTWTGVHTDILSSSSCGDMSRWWGGLSNSRKRRHTQHVIPHSQSSRGQLLSYWCTETQSSGGWSRHRDTARGQMVSECVLPPNIKMPLSTKLFVWMHRQMSSLTLGALENTPLITFNS